MCVAALLLLACTAASSVHAESAAPPAPSRAVAIGRVVIASGLVEADDRAGTRRALAKGAPVFEGDLLQTGPAARTQITFFDGARLALRPATRLRVEAYHDAAAARAEQVAFRLERGGFRTSTGRIGRSNHAAYRFSTPQAVIGIRGTDWGAELVESDAGGDPVLQVGVNDGGITISNDAGTLDLGADAAFSYAVIETFTSPPTGVETAPAGLGEALGSALPDADEAPAASDGESAAAPDATQAEEGDEAEGSDDKAAAANGDAAGSSAGEGSVGDEDSSADAPLIEFGGGAADEDGVVFEYSNRCF